MINQLTSYNMHTLLHLDLRQLISTIADQDTLNKFISGVYLEHPQDSFLDDFFLDNEDDSITSISEILSIHCTEANLNLAEALQAAKALFYTTKVNLAQEQLEERAKEITFFKKRAKENGETLQKPGRFLEMTNDTQKIHSKLQSLLDQLSRKEIDIQDLHEALSPKIISNEFFKKIGFAIQSNRQKLMDGEINEDAFREALDKEKEEIQAKYQVPLAQDEAYNLQVKNYLTSIQASLVELEKQIPVFEMKAKESGETLQTPGDYLKATAAITELCSSIRSKYLDLTGRKININSFYKTSFDAVTKAYSALEQHNTLKKILGNLLLMLGLLIFYPVAMVINNQVNNKYLFFSGVHSEKELKTFKGCLDNFPIPEDDVSSEEISSFIR